MDYLGNSVKTSNVDNSNGDMSLVKDICSDPLVFYNLNFFFSLQTENYIQLIFNKRILIKNLMFVHILIINLNVLI